MPRVVHTRLKGNVLGSFEIENTIDKNQAVITEGVVEFRKTKIAPLIRQQNSYEQEIFLRQQELGQLKRIAKACGSGDVGLINLLSDTWRGRLEIGASILGKLPKPARALLDRTRIYVDGAGVELPPESLDADGKPDLPSRSMQA